MRAAALSVLLALGPGCDTAHDERFRGAPLFAISGRVELVGAAPARFSEEFALRAALRWETVSDVAAALASPEQQVELALSFPTGVSLSIYERPSERLMEVLMPLDGRVAIGQVIVYDDANGNRLFDSDAEQVFGLGAAAVVYAARPVRGPRIDVPAGFSLMLLGGCLGERGLIGVPVDEVHIPIFVDGVGTWPDVRGRVAPRCVEADHFHCAGMAARRERCRVEPELPSCAACDRIFALGTPAIACDTWRTDCTFDPRYDPAECDAEWRVCHCGGAADCTPYGLAAPD